MKGITYIEGTVKGTSKVSEDVRFLVDSGATYSLLPKKVAEKIGLEPKRKMTFTLADGTSVVRSVSECYISIANGEGHTPIIIGEEGDEALLGVVTLEILGMVFNPFNRTLHPMKMLLM